MDARKLLVVGLVALGLWLAIGGQAAAGVLDPSNPDLVLWLKADAVTGVTSGGALASWTDSSGKGNTVTQGVAANQPTYIAHMPQANGQAIVRFDGNDVLANALNPTMPLTVFGVTRYNTGTSTHGWLGGGNGTMSFGAYPQNTHAPVNSFWAWAPNQASTYGQANSLDTAWHTQAYAIPSTTETAWTWYLDGTPTGAAGLATGNPQPYTTGLRVGSSGSGAEYWNGDVAEIIVFKSALTAGQMTEVQDYLAAKYTVNPVSALQSPIAVPLSSGPRFGNDPLYDAARAIDGNLTTFCCLLDDTLTGGSGGTNPPNAANPVTGHMIFDLGMALLVDGARLTGRSDASNLNPWDVDFFYYVDDNPFNNAVPDAIGTDPDIVLLVNHIYPALASGAYQDMGWDALWRRYIGMRINTSYEDGPTYFNYQIGEIQFYTYTPEPTSLALLGLGALGLLRRRRARS